MHVKIEKIYKLLMKFDGNNYLGEYLHSLSNLKCGVSIYLF